MNINSHSDNQTQALIPLRCDGLTSLDRQMNAIQRNEPNMRQRHHGIQCDAHRNHEWKCTRMSSRFVTRKSLYNLLSSLLSSFFFFLAMVPVFALTIVSSVFFFFFWYSDWHQLIFKADLLQIRVRKIIFLVFGWVVCRITKWRSTSTHNVHTIAHTKH